MPEHQTGIPGDYTLGELHDLLWSVTLPTAARRLDCDKDWLREFCDYSVIPLPKADYWQKKRSGKRVHQRRLPKGLDRRETIAALVERRRRGQPPIDPIEDEQDVLDLIAVIDELEVEFRSPDSKARLHPVVAATRRVMKKTARDQWSTRFNRIRRRSSFAEPVFIAEVGVESVVRTAHLLQGLVEAVRKLGGDVDASRGDVACIELLGVLHRVRVRERLKRHREAAESRETVRECWRPTGVLELHVESWLGGDLLEKWTDRRAPLEAQMRDILVGLVRVAQVTRAEHRARQLAEEQAKREREERRREAEEAERHKHRGKALLEVAQQHAAWSTVARLLHGFRGGGALPGDLEHWLFRAEAAAQELNPLADGVASLRDAVEKRVDEQMRGWHYYDRHY